MLAKAVRRPSFVRADAACSGMRSSTGTEQRAVHTSLVSKPNTLSTCQTMKFPTFLVAFAALLTLALGAPIFEERNCTIDVGTS